MLFGSENLQRKLMEEVRECEEEKGVKVVYGAVLGSISRGAQLRDSDYDTRFLYIRKDFPETILRAESLPEEAVIFRKPLEGACFEQVPFWELSSFMGYLAYPSIDGAFSTGLYQVVWHTLFSPYAWDPYGLQQKVIPIAQLLFHKGYYMEGHKHILSQRCYKSMGGGKRKSIFEGAVVCLIH